MKTLLPVAILALVFTACGGGGGSYSSGAPGGTTPPPGGTPPPPPSPPASSADFTTRCNAPGVIRCVAFDNASDISGTWGNNSGILPDDSKAPPALDTNVKASGNSSLKFTIAPGPESHGSYFTNFSSDLSMLFGPNQEFYIQWRQRFSPEFLNTFYTNGGGWKQVIIGTGDKPGVCDPNFPTSATCPTSCTALETVVQNTDQVGFAQMYNSCTKSSSHGGFDGFYEPYLSSDFKLQNARPIPYCLSSQGPSNYFPPTGNCFGYFANEWMTFQVHIKLGPRGAGTPGNPFQGTPGAAPNDEFVNSFIQLWIAREGKPSEPVINWGPYNLTAGPAAEDWKFGKIWLLPYHTNKSLTQIHPTGFTWYDELIISKTQIADPAP